MPSTYNGIGTNYWGKANLVSRRGTCEFCGRTTEIKSYDTTLYFVVLYLPVIPLKKKRVLDYCSACTRHRTVPQKVWDESKRADLDAAADAATSDRGNDEKAAAAVGTAIGYQSAEDFDLFAEEFGAALPNGPKTQAAIGAGHAAFGRPAESEAAYRRSLAAEDDPAVREQLAVLLMRENRPDEARQLLGAKVTDPEKVGLLYLLAESYQGQGMHAQALAALDEAEELKPAGASDKYVAKLRKQSQKHLSTGKAIRPATLAPVDAKAKPPGGSDRSALLAKLLVPALLLVAAVVYIGVAMYQGHAHKVYLVSGLPVASAVEVAGKTYALPPLGREEISVAEGEVPFRVTAVGGKPDVNTPLQTATLHTPFWSRPFNRMVFILNPDEAAIVVVDAATYVPDTETAPEPERPTYLAGQPLYELAGIDFPFEPFPDEIKLEGKYAERKQNVTLYRPDSTTDAVSTLVGGPGESAAADYLAHRMALAPDDADLPLIAATVMPPAAAIAALKPGLDAVPVRLQWHRAYQSLMERAEPDTDLRPEYEKRLAADPSNPALLYLLGRVTPDRDAAQALFAKSTQGPAPSAYGYYALAYDAMCRADYAAALDAVNRALQIDPRGSGFPGTQQEALSALGRYREALADLRAARPTDGGVPRYGAVEQEVYLLTRDGDAGGAQSAKANYARTLRMKANAGVADFARRQLDALSAYLRGDQAACRDLLLKPSPGGGPPGANQRFQAALGAGDPATAQAALKSSGEDFTGDGGHVLCLLYLCAEAAGKADPDRYLTPAVDALKAGDRDSRRAAAMLAATTAPPMADVAALQMLPEQKRVVLAALGLRHPPIRAACFELARKFDYDTRFPHLLVAAVIGPK